MSEYLSDQEQADRVIKLIKKHGYNVFIAIMLGLTAYFGFQYWQNKQANDNAMASNDFQGITEQKQKIQLLQLQEKPIPQAEKTKLLSGVEELVKAYPNSIYAQQALMLEAQYFVEANELAKAQTALEKAKAAFTKDVGVTNVINLRLAQVMTANKQPKEALTLLNSVTDDAFKASKLEIMGDAYVALGNNKEAKAAYQSAWQTNLKENDANQILRLKMEKLGMMPSNTLAETENDSQIADVITDANVADTAQSSTKQEAATQETAKQETASQEPVAKDVLPKETKQKATQQETNQQETQQQKAEDK